MSGMDVGSELRRLLVEELCAIIEGWTQCDAASLLGLRQPQVSRLRRGVTAGFSVDRLVRLIASQGYHVEVRLTAMERRFGNPRPEPEVRVLRFDRHGMPARRATGGDELQRRSGGWDASDSFSGI